MVKPRVVGATQNAAATEALARAVGRRVEVLERVLRVCVCGGLSCVWLCVMCGSIELRAGEFVCDMPYLRREVACVVLSFVLLVVGAAHTTNNALCEDREQRKHVFACPTSATVYVYARIAHLLRFNT